MGQSDSTALGAQSTALEVYQHFTIEKGHQFLNGKTVVVTGGNSGIGLETCKVFAYGGARVILCSRSVSAGQKAVDEEIVVPGHGGYTADASNIVVKQLDLNSLRSVKSFCEDLLATESRIDYLICNAGIMALPKHEFTEDGFEKQIGVNLFGHFYLTQQLLPKMQSQNFESRVVVLASTAHTMGTVVPSDLHFKNGRSYNNWVSYGQSKLADILFAKELADRTEGSQLTACSVHPGVIQTNLWRSSFFSGGLGASLLGMFVANKTIPQGAASTMWACLSPSIMTVDRGAYISDCAPVLPNADGQDVNGKMRKALWETADEQIKEAIKDF
ncbi:Rdh14 [Symbiodinium microadriaticum]|nr:Rdh14 [Symbiodinium microadriaticum]